MKIYKCIICQNLTKDKKGNYICPAFPDGIPQEKMTEEDQGTDKPCKGDIWFKSSLKADQK